MLTRDGSKVAFVRNDELFVIDLASESKSDSSPKGPGTA